MGDGNLSDGRYVISGNRRNETLYYEEVLRPLIHSLYSLEPSIAFENNSVYLRVYSKELVSFKHDRIGLPIGRKKELRIPDVATRDAQLTAQIVSGLYDTDGSVKVRRDKSGNYPRISLAQKHPHLVRETMSFLQSVGITSTMYRNDYFDPRTTKTETRWFLDVNGFPNFDRFTVVTGTRNPYVETRMKTVLMIR